MSRALPTAAFLVLGFVERMGEATPYDLKTFAARSTNFVFMLPHTQIYTQCERLVGESLLDERREEGGRRRRLLTITEGGRRALDDWRADSTPVPVEARDLALLKVFFGADPKVIGPEQVRMHRERLAQYRELEALRSDLPDGVQATLDFGLRYEKALVEFWTEYVEGQ